MTWVLQLNRVTMAHVEDLIPACRANSKEELKAFLEREKVEPYRDGQWGKNFRKGGPLEWFNPPWPHDEDRHFVEVNVAERVLEYRARLEAGLLGIPEVA